MAKPPHGTERKIVMMSDDDSLGRMVVIGG